MNSIVYVVGLVVIVIAVLSFFGLPISFCALAIGRVFKPDMFG